MTYEPRKCKGCQNMIYYSNYLEELGAKWHMECFKCNTCKKPLEINLYRYKEDDPYCPFGNCWKVGGGVQMKREVKEGPQKNYWYQCFKCNEQIREDVVCAHGKNYHQDHFLCTGCGKKIKLDEFFHIDDKPYCSSACFLKHRPNTPVNSAVVEKQ